MAREKEERRGEERGGILNITYAAGLRAELAVEKKLKKEKEVAHIAIYLYGTSRGKEKTGWWKACVVSVMCIAEVT